MNDIDFEEAFGRIPLLENMSPHDFEITALPGFTNLNFRLLSQENDYVLRIPRSETSRYIDRRAEAFNVDRVIRLGLAPKLLWRDNSGLSLSRCITNSNTVTMADLQDTTILSLLVERLADLHSADLIFKGKVDLPALLTRCLKLLPVERNQEFAACFEKALVIHRTIEDKDQRTVPSHNDLVLENLLIDHEGRLWMIDWEYSAMASPYWDLATLCNAARLDPEQCQRLLDLYNNPVPTVNYKQLRGHQFMLQVLTIGWLAVFSTEPLDDEVDWLNRLDV